MALTVERPISCLEMGEGVQVQDARKIPCDAQVWADVDWNGTPRELTRTVFLTQVINHATEHRAQIVAV